MPCFRYQVASVAPDGPAAGKLEVGDALVELDGEKVGSLNPAEVGALIGEKRKLSLEIDRQPPCQPWKLLVYMNPFSGTKKAPTVLASVVAPMCAAAGIEFELVETTHCGHAEEHASEFDQLDAYNAVVTISGDGLLFEVVNGLMSRPDWETAIKTPLGIIPAGTGNGLAHSIGTPCPVSAMLAIIKGDSRPLDLCSVRQVS